MADRGVSSVLGYALALAIVTILISGIFAGMGTVVENQRETAIRSELTVIGNRIAADISAVDRLVLATSSTADVRIATTLPRTVAGKAYSINVSDGGPPSHRYRIDLSSSDPDITETVFVRSNTTVRDVQLQGGDVEVVFDGTTVEVVHD